METPNLQDLANFDPAYGFSMGVELIWLFEVTGSNRSVAETFRGSVNPITGRPLPGLAGFEVETTRVGGAILP
jgi:hypothetical protein